MRSNLLRAALRHNMPVETVSAQLRNPKSSVAQDVKIAAQLQQLPSEIANGLIQASGSSPNIIRDFITYQSAKNYPAANRLLRDHQINFWINGKGELQARTVAEDARTQVWDSTKVAKGAVAEDAQTQVWNVSKAVKGQLAKAGLLSQPIEHLEALLRLHLDSSSNFSLGNLVSLMKRGMMSAANEYLGTFDVGLAITRFGRLRVAEKLAEGVDSHDAGRVVESRDAIVDPESTAVTEGPAIISEQEWAKAEGKLAARRRIETDDLGAVAPLEIWDIPTSRLSAEEVKGLVAEAKEKAFRVQNAVVKLMFENGVEVLSDKHIPVTSFFEWQQRADKAPYVEVVIKLDGKARAAELESELQKDFIPEQFEVTRLDGLDRRYIVKDHRGENMIIINVEVQEQTTTPKLAKAVHSKFTNESKVQLLSWASENTSRGKYAQGILFISEKHTGLLAKGDLTARDLETLATTSAYLADAPQMIREHDVLHRAELVLEQPERQADFLRITQLRRKVIHLGEELRHSVTTAEAKPESQQPLRSEVLPQYQKALAVLSDLVSANSSTVMPVRIDTSQGGRDSDKIIPLDIDNVILGKPLSSGGFEMNSYNISAHPGRIRLLTSEFDEFSEAEIGVEDCRVEVSEEVRAKVENY